MKKPSLEAYSAAIEELTRRHGHCTIHLPFLHVMAIIGAVQLALRHPNFPATSHELLTDWINEMATQLPSATLRATIRAGFDPACDEESSQ